MLLSGYQCTKDSLTEGFYTRFQQNGASHTIYPAFNMSKWRGLRELDALRQRRGALRKALREGDVRGRVLTSRDLHTRTSLDRAIFAPGHIRCVALSYRYSVHL